MSKIFNRAISTAVAVSALAVNAGVVWAAEEEKPKFAYSFNVGVTTDYVYRGYSQKAGDPAFQGGLDLSYAVLNNVTAYFGVWSSGVDFGRNPDQSRIAAAEVDIYGGLKPVWGPANFDLGVIWYTYPGSRDAGDFRSSGIQPRLTRIVRSPASAQSRGWVTRAAPCS